MVCEENTESFSRSFPLLDVLFAAYFHDRDFDGLSELEALHGAIQEAGLDYARDLLVEFGAFLQKTSIPDWDKLSFLANVYVQSEGEFRAWVEEMRDALVQYCEAEYGAGWR